MLTLIFGREESVRNAVVDTYGEIYFDPGLRPGQKAANLLELMRDASLTDVTCIEELLRKILEQDLLETAVYAELWRRYVQAPTPSDVSQSQAE